MYTNNKKFNWKNIKISKNYAIGENKDSVILMIPNQAGEPNWFWIKKTQIKTSQYTNLLDLGIAQEYEYRAYIALGKDAKYYLVNGESLYNHLKTLV